MKKCLILIICLLLWCYGCNKDKQCGDEYDRCCDECYEYYKKTGLSTECYGECYDKFAECEEDKDNPFSDIGCFIEMIGKKEGQ